MQKLFYLLFDDVDSDGSRLREALAGRVVPVLRESGAEEISSFVNDDAVAAGSPICQSDPPIRAGLSFFWRMRRTAFRPRKRLVAS